MLVLTLLNAELKNNPQFYRDKRLGDRAKDTPPQELDYLACLLPYKFSSFVGTPACA